MPRIIRHIDPVSQPRGSTLCWAATIAMITGRSGGRVIDDIVREANARHVAFDNGTLDRHRGVPTLAAAFGLQHIRRTSAGFLPGSELESRIGRAPVGLFGLLSETVDGTPRHAVAIHGIIGDFVSAQSTTVHGVDPRGYSSINMSFFQLQMELRIEWLVWRA
jgi:hypothetical protein